MELNGEFKDKTVLITGATSDISRTISELFYDAGANLILSDNIDMIDKLKLVKSKLQKEEKGNIDIINIDLTNVESIKKLDGIYVDILVNCAGRNKFKKFLEVSEEDWDDIIDVNLKGTFFVSQVIANNMVNKNIKGKIINIGSQHGVVANGLRSPYCVSKFGIVGMTKVLALELSQYNILVNCVSPTYVETEKSKEFLANKNVRNFYLPYIPLKKFAKPIDIANVVIFLALDSNKMITGENIMVDGGYTIH